MVTTSTAPITQLHTCLDELAPTSVLERAEHISARKKLIRSMSLNTDRLINRATVVGCAISATRNYLKLQMPRTLNPLLWTFMPKRESCGSVLHCGWPPLDPMPSTAPTCSPHRACCTAGCPPTAISCLGASRTPAASARGGSRHAGVRETYTVSDLGPRPSPVPDSGLVEVQRRCQKSVHSRANHSEVFSNKSCCRGEIPGQGHGYAVAGSLFASKTLEDRRWPPCV